MQSDTFSFKLKCRGCGAPKMIKMVAYPYVIGSLAPVSMGPDAHCTRCGKAQLEFVTVPDPPPPSPPPKGFATDPRKKS